MAKSRNASRQAAGLFAATFALATAAAGAARADDPPRPLPSPLDDPGHHVLDALGGTSLLWFGGALAATATMSASGADHAVRVFAQEHVASAAWSDAAYYTGYALPAVSAPALWLVGVATHDEEVAGAGAAAIQALVTTMTLTTLLKVVTGRPYPLNGGDPAAPDRLDHPEYARTWTPFAFDGRYAWPSGHTAGTLSIAAAVTAYTWPERPWVPFVGYPVALAIGAGMISGDRHWASDVVAGALIAHAVGWSIGRSFRAQRRGDRAPAPDRPNVTVVPLTGGVGLALAGTL